MQQRLRKVVFPVAGLGTRFLPATKVVAKEMLPVLDRPLIQYAVDEAVDAGADTLIFVTNRYKHAIADYFDKAYELEAKLAQSGKNELLALVQGTLPRNVRCVFVTQPEAFGLGHAVLCARPVVGNEPFGVILPDDLIWNGAADSGQPGALRQMAKLSADNGGAGVIAVEEVPHEDTNKYGIVDAEAMDGRAAKIRLVVEKPKPEVAPSNLNHCCIWTRFTPTASKGCASTAATNSAWFAQPCTWPWKTRNWRMRHAPTLPSAARTDRVRGQARGPGLHPQSSRRRA